MDPVADLVTKSPFKLESDLASCERNPSGLAPWPGVSAGLGLGVARQAHVGPDRAGHVDQFGSLGGLGRCCTGPSSSPHDYSARVFWLEGTLRTG